MFVWGQSDARLRRGLLHRPVIGGRPSKLISCSRHHINNQPGRLRSDRIKNEGIHNLRWSRKVQNNSSPVWCDEVAAKVGNEAASFGERRWFSELHIGHINDDPIWT